MINKYALRCFFWDTLFKIVFFICYPTKKMRERARNRLPVVDDPDAIPCSSRSSNKSK